MRSGNGVHIGPVIGSSISACWRTELCVLCIDPRLVIILVFDIQRLLRNLERTEAVHHHRELIGVLGANTRLCPARMRTEGALEKAIA